MKVLRLLVGSLFLTFVLAFLAIAQTEKPSTVSSLKFGEINTDLFYDEKSGIPELARAKKELDAEIAAKFDVEIKPKLNLTR